MENDKIEKNKIFSDKEKFRKLKILIKSFRNTEYSDICEELFEKMNL